jgi:hypothetical protein
MPSIVEQTPYNESTANGVATVFPYTFELLDAADLVVYADGVEVPDSEYSVSGVGDQAGGNVTFTVAPADGVVILRSREIALERDTDYQYNGDLREETLDRDFNRVWQALQGFWARITGTLRAPYPEQLDEMPAAADRALKILSFDADGQPTATAPVEGTATALALQLADTSSASNGDALIGQLRTFTGAVATSAHAALEKQQIHVAADAGVSTASSQATTRTAVQTAIAAASVAGNTSGGSTVFVSPYLNYGYKAADTTTWPDLSAVTQPMLLQDLSAGNSYAGYPTGYDGMQVRWTFCTPQTTAALTFTAGLAGGATSGTLTGNFTGVTGPYTVTFSNGDSRAVTLTNGATTATWTGGLSGAATANATRLNPGQHDGNTFHMRASWAPYIVLDNIGNYDAAGSSTRRALDNRRAAFATANDGVATWQIGQQGEIGANKTDEEMSNWALQKFSVAGDTLGAYTPYQVNRKTARVSYGGGRTNPNGVHHFESSFTDTSVPMILAENSFGTDCKVSLRNSSGSGQDVSIVNNAGRLEISTNGGVGLAVNLSDGTVEALTPIKFAGYVRAALPNAATLSGYTIRVNDATGGITNAISDGANWISLRTNAAV